MLHKKSNEILKKEFDGEDGTFLIKTRCKLAWDWKLLKSLHELCMMSLKNQIIKIHLKPGLLMDLVLRYMDKGMDKPSGFSKT